MGNSGYPLAQINRTSISNRTFKKHRFYTFQKGASAVMWKMSRTSLTPDKRLKIYISNIFDINIDDIGKFDIIWESGVQTVLKIEDRERYSKLMRTLCKDEFKYLLHTLQHEGNVDAIPRPISHEIIQKIFDDWCRIVVQSQYMNPYLKSQGVNIAFRVTIYLTPK
ncbi:hypothetical protein Avbf_01349 [Armadillidium vulgare]|nr:hypothetical protein Avbf_01349 [Armadillidium vulgare]